MKQHVHQTRVECTVGLTSSWSIKVTPHEDFAEASKTAQSFVEVLDSFTSVCIGKEEHLSCPFFKVNRGNGFGVAQLEMLFHGVTELLKLTVDGSEHSSERKV